MDMFAKYLELVEGAYQDKKLSKSHYESLIKRKSADLDELDQNYRELKYSLDNAPYYMILDRITKAEEVIAAETDMKKKDRYIKAMKNLCDQLERMQLLAFEPTKAELAESE